MINVATIRAAVQAAPGDMVAMSKTQLAELLGEVEAGQQALRHLQELDDVERIAGGGTDPIWVGYDAGIDVDQAQRSPQ